MTLTLELTDEQTRRLEQRADELGIDLRELATAAVNDLLARPAEDFQKAASYVLGKNRELYERLA